MVRHARALNPAARIDEASCSASARVAADANTAPPLPVRCHATSGVTCTGAPERVCEMRICTACGGLERAPHQQRCPVRAPRSAAAQDVTIARRPRSPPVARAAYVAAVELGTVEATATWSAGVLSGSSTSPLPRTRCAPSASSAGMSLPMRSAAPATDAVSISIPRPASIAAPVRSTAAASADPPPRPAPWGTFLLARAGSRVAAGPAPQARGRRAQSGCRRRWARPPQPDRHRERHGVASSANAMLTPTRSCQSIGTSTLSMSCHPSARRATRDSERFSFAYAGTTRAERRDTDADILLPSCVPGWYAARAARPRPRET